MALGKSYNEEVYYGYCEFIFKSHPKYISWTSD